MYIYICIYIYIHLFIYISILIRMYICISRFGYKHRCIEVYGR